MKPRRKLLRGIREKLLLSFSLLVLVLAAFIVVFFPARLERQAMRATMAEAETIRNMTAYTLSPALVFGDVAAIRETLLGVASHQNVRFLSVRDDRGVLLASQGKESPGAGADAGAEGYITESGGLHISSVPITHDERSIGTLTVGISLAKLRADVQAARRLGIIVGLLVCVAGVAVVYAISLLITRPLNAVSQTVRRIAAGDLSLRADETTDAEVAELVRAFNQLVDSLAGAQEELSQTNQALEVRVDERTKELREAIANQRRVQVALRESESEAQNMSSTLASLVEVAPMAIVAVNVDGLVTRWNKAAEHLFGWTEAEVSGCPVPCMTLAQMEELRSRGPGPAVGGFKPEEVSLQCKHGRSVIALFSAAVLHDETGRSVGYILVATDLTARKSLEQQLRQSQKMDAIGRLAGGVAHDFNNILTIITATADMVLEHTPDGVDREDLIAIGTAAGRGASLTRQLLLFSRQEVVQLRAVLVDDVIRGMRPMLQRLLPANIKFSSVSNAPLGHVNADPSQLEQVILNLVVNAADAMPDGGALAITTSDVEGGENQGHSEFVDSVAYVCMSVSDTGVGIDPEIIAKIFEPFFTTKPVGRGTGLGLATSYAVISQIGGHIRVRSKPGKGTTFDIFIPQLEVKPEVSEADSGMPERVTRSPEAPPATILLVEDEAGLRKVLRRRLELLGYSVVDAADGETGLSLLHTPSLSIDLVMTDIMMPGMNGHRLAEMVQEIRPGLPVIFMSGYTSAMIRDLGLVDSTHAFLQKPFAMEDLSRLVAKMLHASAEAALQTG